MRIEGDFIKINEWLTPLSWLYGLGVGIRNQLFELGILRQNSFDVPVISVGNITVGGSGKTPHVEYLIRLLQDKAQVAVLSRGYKRKSNGYQLANDNSTMQTIGDEPYQMKQKFPSIHVAVDANRCRGIRHSINEEPTNHTDVILLDDAFQHRYVKPGINILLVDYHRLIIYDKLMPAGRLREPLSGKDRADVVIITKCPKDLKPMEFRVLSKAMNLYPYQSLYFTTLEYATPKQLFGENELQLHELRGRQMMLLTGIASPEQIIVDMTQEMDINKSNIKMMRFADHHQFSTKDVENINNTFNTMPQGSIIVTTEKDATRLKDLEGLSQKVKDNIYTLPIKVKFMEEQQEEIFNNKIIDYVRKNSRNSILVKRKDDNKSKDGNHLGNGTRTISF
jgi:tetraacyldisaccharide 4'-kinase